MSRKLSVTYLAMGAHLEASFFRVKCKPLAIERSNTLVKINVDVLVGADALINTVRPP